MAGKALCHKGCLKIQSCIKCNRLPLPGPLDSPDPVVNCGTLAWLGFGGGVSPMMSVVGWEGGGGLALGQPLSLLDQGC